MELHLGLALSTNPSTLLLDLNSRAYEANCSFRNKKRSYSQLIREHDHAPAESSNRNAMLPTLSLLPPNRDDDDDEEHRSPYSTIITKSDEEEDGEALVGWPPVNYWRKKLRSSGGNIYGDDEVAVAGNYDHHVLSNIHHHHHHRHGGCGGLIARSKNGMYVKVKMEGVGIARKVDLTMHRSFHTLKETLMHMFGKCHQQFNRYELAYQDKEGDWLLAEDVPWRSFIQCALRLKLLKSRV